MTYTPIPAGTQNWDVPVNAAFTNQDAAITANADAINQLGVRTSSLELNNNITLPSDHGLISWSIDPFVTNASMVLPQGVITMIKLPVRTQVVVSNVNTAIVTGGTGLTAGACFAGLYSTSGNLVAQTADQSGVWNSTGHKQMPLTAPFLASPGYYYFAMLSNAATTNVTIMRGSTQSTATFSANQSIADARVTVFGSGLTALPATINMSARTLNSTTMWCGLS